MGAKNSFFNKDFFKIFHKNIFLHKLKKLLLSSSYVRICKNFHFLLPARLGSGGPVRSTACKFWNVIIFNGFVGKFLLNLTQSTKKGIEWYINLCGTKKIF